MAGVCCGTPRRTNSLHAVPAFSILVLDVWPEWQFPQAIASLYGAGDVRRRIENALVRQESGESFALREYSRARSLSFA